MIMKSRIILSACLLTFSLMASANQESQQQALSALEQEKSITNIYQAYFPDESTARKTAISFHGQLLESKMAEGYLILELTLSEMQQLREFDYKFKPATDYIERRNQRLKQAQLSLNQDITLQTIPGYSCYETVEETFSSLQSMVSSHPTLAQLIDVGDSWEKSQGIGGYDMQVLKLTNSTISGSKPILFINSAIHAREYTTAPLNLAFARWLLDGYGVNADATWILDYHEVHLMLQTNPDGRKKAETGLSWRKNANQNYCGATSNSRGADLNRNFTFKWDATNGSGSSGSQCNSTYRGPTPASEPEVQALENYVRSIFADNRGENDNDAAPDTTTGMHIDLHSYSELVLWPWGATNQVAPNGIAMQTLGRKFANFNGYYPQQSVGLYATDGTSDNVSYGELGVPAFTFELGTSFFQNCSTYESTILPDNLPALVYAAKVVSAPYITPSGPDIINLTINGSGTSGVIPPGGSGALSASATDTRFSSANGSESTQSISQAEYYIDVPPWVSGATAIALTASDGSFNSSTEGVVGTISTNGLTQGQHIIYVRTKDAAGIWGAVSAIFIDITNETIPDDGLLENAVAKAGLSGSQNDEVFYYLDVPADATSLQFELSGGSGDADMYVRYGQVPNQNDWDCRPYVGGNNETCTMSNIQAGTYHVMLRGYSAYSGASLTGTYTVSTGGENSFETTTNVDIPDNNATGVTSSLSVTRAGESGAISIEVDIVHTYIGDLVVDLIAPDGSSFNLHNQSGGSSNNINQTYSVDIGTLESSGNWQLKVSDHASRDTGYIDRFKITFP